MDQKTVSAGGTSLPSNYRETLGKCCVDAGLPESYADRIIAEHARRMGRGGPVERALAQPEPAGWAEVEAAITHIVCRPRRGGSTAVKRSPIEERDHLLAALRPLWPRERPEADHSGAWADLHTLPAEIYRLGHARRDEEIVSFADRLRSGLAGLAEREPAPEALRAALEDALPDGSFVTSEAGRVRRQDALDALARFRWQSAEAELRLREAIAKHRDQTGIGEIVADKSDRDAQETYRPEIELYAALAHPPSAGAAALAALPALPAELAYRHGWTVEILRLAALLRAAGLETT